MSFSAGREPKIVVLDDDPTGIQMVHDVAVYTSWEESACVNLLREEETMVFILTNTRALKPEAARRLLRECTQNLMAASKQTGVPFWLVLRSDSTLRGHYPLESETVREVLQEQGIEVAGEILCPYLQGMRITRDDLHYLKQEDRWLPVGESEFAWDKTFGFHASDLKAYVEEKTQGRYPAASCLSISLEILRSQDEAAITRILRQAHDFQKIIINAETDDDLRALMPPLKTVLKEKTFLFRTAASFCKIYADQSEKPLMDPQACVQRKNQNGGLIVAGSHVQKTTRQLEVLRQNSCLETIIFDQHQILQGTLAEESERCARLVNQKLAAGITVVLQTRRERVDLAQGSAEDQLRLTQAINDQFIRIVEQLTISPRFMITKGGITSSDCLTRGLRVRREWVLGQIELGIGVVRCDSASRFPDLPVVLFPGNVEDEDTLAKIVSELEGCHGKGL